MKKLVIIFILCIAIIGVLFWKIKANNSEKVVGTYYNSDQDATVILNEDGSCKCPVEEANCKWNVSGDNIVITIASTKEQEIEVFMDYEATEDEISKLREQLSRIDGVNSVTFVSKEDAFNRMKERFEKNENVLDGFSENVFSVSFIVKFVDLGFDNEIYNKISSLEGVKRTTRKSSFVPVTKLEGTITNKGMMLGDYFYKKIN